MANGNKRLPNAFDRRFPRRNPYTSTGAYDYGPAAVLTEDFGEIGRGLEKGFDEAIDAATKAEERLDKYTKEAQESQDFEHTGINSIDNATSNIAYSAKEQLFDRKSLIGTQVPTDEKDRKGNVKTRMFTINDFNKFKNNLINNSKVWSGQLDLVNKTLEEYGKNENVSDVTKEAYLQSVGVTVNKDASYDVVVMPDGNFQVVSKTMEMGALGNMEEVKTYTNYKQTAINKTQEVNKFDAVADIENFKKTYAKRKKTFTIGNEVYRADEVLADMGLFTKHITEQSDEFDPALEAYVENFSNDKQKVIDYASKMGVKFGERKRDDNGNPTDQIGVTVVDPDTGIGKFKEDTNRIVIEEDGTLTLGEEARKNAKKRFKEAALGAFGKEEEVKINKFRKQTDETPDSPEFGVTVGGNVVKTFNTNLDPTSVSEFNNETGLPETKQQAFSFKDVSFSVFAANSLSLKQARDDYDKDFNETDNDDYYPAAPKTVSKEGESKTIQNTGNFRADNSDLYKTDGSSKLVGFGDLRDEKVTTENIKNRHIQMDSFALGVDMTQADLSELGITSVKNSRGGGRQLTGVSGVAFTYERYKNKGYKNPTDANLVGTAEDLENKYPRRAIGLRLIGNTVQSVIKSDQKSASATDNAPTMVDEQGSQTLTSIADTATKKETQTLTTDMISDTQIPQIIKLMAKKTEGLKRIFERYASQSNISNTQAFYKTMNQLKLIQASTKN